MKLNSRQPDFFEPDNSAQQFSLTDKQYIPSGYSYPELYRLLEFDLKSPPSSTKNPLLYLVCAFASLTLLGLSLCLQFTEVKQAFQDVQNTVYDDYSALIDN